jgi:hypothetical protein
MAAEFTEAKERPLFASRRKRLIPEESVLRIQRQILFLIVFLSLCVLCG